MTLDQEVEIDGIQIVPGWVSEATDVPRRDRGPNPLDIATSLHGGALACFPSRDAAQAAAALVRQCVQRGITDTEETTPGN